MTPENKSGDKYLSHSVPQVNTDLPAEQQVCVECGFCCDGTLFLHACLNPGERGHLPQKIEENSFTEDGKDYFRLPCEYFSGRCIIYKCSRADVCGSYRCQLLKDMAEDKITIANALETVRSARELREELFALYSNLEEDDNELNFRQLLINLGRREKMHSDKGDLSAVFDFLLAKVNIFEALLIKHMRSSAEFEKMMI